MSVELARGDTLFFLSLFFSLIEYCFFSRLNRKENQSIMGSFAIEKADQEVLPYDSIGGPTYITAQTLIQQVSYALSDKLFTYSPETFDLDTAVKQWANTGEKNANGYKTSVQPMQTRQGAGTIALGYIFSQDFDLKKRHIPQTIIASSATLQYLRSSLEQLTLLYSVANPFVAHVSAVDYRGGSDGHLVTDYHTALRLSEELGLGLVATASTHESQHMALFSTLLAKFLPTLHIYDGIKIGRENTRVIDVFSQSHLNSLVKSIYKTLEGTTTQKHLDVEGKLLGLLQAFNDELGTDYKPFEYHGHAEATSILVTFGTVESSLTAQIADALAQSDVKVGVVNVRIYRPFVEEEFLKVLPASAQTIGILGQVPSELDVQEEGVHSPLYEDVLATVLFGRTGNAPKCVELKYSTSKTWIPETIVDAFKSVSTDVLPGITQLVDESTQQFSFWDVDDSSSPAAFYALSKALAKDTARNVTTSTKYDNLILGGVVRTDIRKSSITLDAPYAINAADAAYVGSVKILSEIDVLASAKENGALLVNAPGVKDDELEKKLPATFRKALIERKIALYLLDSSSIEDDAVMNSTIQTSFAHAALGLENEKVTALLGNDSSIPSAVASHENILRRIDVPESWGTLEEETTEEENAKLPSDITPTSLVPFDKAEEEAPAQLDNWQSIAKSLVFREAYDTKAVLRPDLATKTYTIHVSANKRLTPESYERNIFHIEFDLGDSGLTYDIGEALGIHAENDPEQIEEFIKFYGLDPNAIVPVPSREDEAVFEVRTVYQALLYNIDLFGKPPKRFYEALAEYATDEKEKAKLQRLGGEEGTAEVKKRAEIDFLTYADILYEFPSARPSFTDLVRIVNPMKRREYSIASCQKVTPTSVALMIVVVDWIDSQGRKRWGQASRYLSKLQPGTAVTASVKPSVMKLPPSSTQPLIMAGLGTGLAPFRAFVQHRALEKAQGKEIGSVLLYMGSRHQREEYCYGEEWEAYQAAGVITLLGRAFSRDQPHKVYIQDRMRETLPEITQAYTREKGAFYLCGPTWPVPDVTAVLEEAIAAEAKANGKKVDTKREIEKLKEEERYVLEVY